MNYLQILSELYTRVKGTKGSWRGAILGALYGLVECTSPKILLAVARVVLALGVTGSNLTGACKLVFKVARNEVGFCNSNWGLVLEVKLVSDFRKKGVSITIFRHD